MTDKVVTMIAVTLSVLGLLALAIVVITGLSGHAPAPSLTYFSFIVLPLAFVFLMISLLRAIGRRRRL